MFQDVFGVSNLDSICCDQPSAYESEQGFQSESRSRTVCEEGSFVQRDVLGNGSEPNCPRQPLHTSRSERSRNTIFRTFFTLFDAEFDAYFLLFFSHSVSPKLLEMWNKNELILVPDIATLSNVHNLFFSICIELGLKRKRRMRKPWKSPRRYDDVR